MTEDEKNICSTLWNEFEQDVKRLCMIKLSSNKSAVDDVVSDVFFALCIFVEKNGSPNNPKAWLYSVTYNKINEKFRSLYKNKDRKLCFEYEYELSYDYDFENDVLDKLFIDELKSSLKEKLNDDETKLYNYLYNQNLTLSQTADLLKISKSAVKQRKYRLNNKIRTIAKKNLK